MALGELQVLDRDSLQKTLRQYRVRHVQGDRYGRSDLASSLENAASSTRCAHCQANRSGAGGGHEAGVIQRDLKPANLKVHDSGTVKVLEVGGIVVW